jgi:hypothetical protein
VGALKVVTYGELTRGVSKTEGAYFPALRFC